MSISKPPINLIVIDFPTRYERMSIRKQPRLDICFPALFNDLSTSTPEAKNFRHQPTTLDISLGGALIASKQKLISSQRIALSVKLSSTGKVTNILSVVKNLPKDKRVGNELYHLAGVEFQNLLEGDKAKLVKFIEANRPFRG
jgi:c-di-GMP-binding flagellar brake protein YcgR|tara:strand:+ start:634 stop:1062 length:429 start_codon:yes stop_codon:yes gene_type:complete